MCCRFVGVVIVCFLVYMATDAIAMKLLRQPDTESRQNATSPQKAPSLITSTETASGSESRADNLIPNTELIFTKSGDERFHYNERNVNDNNDVIRDIINEIPLSHSARSPTSSLSSGSSRDTTSEAAVNGMTDRGAAVAQRRLPKVIIIGAKKSGTRALLEFMKIHPDVRAAGPEVHFFDRHYGHGLDWYRSRMPATTNDQVTVEKTPSYLVTRRVPARVRAMNRNVLLVIVVRDPVTRALSDYAQAASKRPDIEAFERLAFIKNNVTASSSSHGCRNTSATPSPCVTSSAFDKLDVNASWGPIRVGHYARHVDRWLRHFPRRQMHFVNGERLVTDPASELSRCEKFIGLRKYIEPSHFDMNSAKGFPCIRRWRTGSAATNGTRRSHCLGQTKGRTHPKVSAEVIHRLRDYFRPLNSKFYRLTGIDFGWP